MLLLRWKRLLWLLWWIGWLALIWLLRRIAALLWITALRWVLRLWCWLLGSLHHKRLNTEAAKRVEEFDFLGLLIVVLYTRNIESDAHIVALLVFVKFRAPSLRKVNGRVVWFKLLASILVKAFLNECYGTPLKRLAVLCRYIFGRANLKHGADDFVCHIIGV